MKTHAEKIKEFEIFLDNDSMILRIQDLIASLNRILNKTYEGKK